MAVAAGTGWAQQSGGQTGNMGNLPQPLAKTRTQATAFKKVENDVVAYDVIDVFWHNVAELNTGLCIIIWFTVYLLSMQAVVKQNKKDNEILRKRRQGERKIAQVILAKKNL